MKVQVRIAKQMDVDFDGFQYINGIWECAIDLNLYHVQEIKHWFWPCSYSTWIVRMFIGADTAAVSPTPGKCYYETVGSEFRSEYAALLFLNRLRMANAKEVAV